MEYPFLCSVARSVLQKLDHGKLKEIRDEKDVEMLKGILSYLPSILETRKSSLDEIQRSVFGLHDLLREHVRSASKSSWADLVLPLTKFQDHLRSLNSKDNLEPVSSISYALPEFEGQVVKNEVLPPHLVPCLAYCALYPKSYRIVRETLVNQWMAEGFLDLPTADSSSADTELEDIGNRYFMELFSMGVFVKPRFCFGGRISNQQEAVTIHSCELPHDIHDFAKKIANKEVVVIDSPEYHFQDYQPMYLALHQTSYGHAVMFPERLRILKSFVSNVKPAFSPDSTSQFLQILDLGETNLSDFLGLEVLLEIRKLFKGTYLAFSRNKSLQGIDEFLESSKQQLQTLAVDGCIKLEKVNLEDTSYMRHLYYTSKDLTLKIHTSSLRILQLSECSELRSLSLGNVANFSYLRRLRIYKCPRLVYLPDSMDVLPRVEELVFHNCARLDLNSGRSMSFLPKLRHMELIGLPELTELPAGLKSAGAALKYLMIADCKSLKSTDPNLPILQHLGTLEKLFVYNCPNLSIEPGVFQSLTALQSLDITLNLLARAREDLRPFISHIPEVILDGQLLHWNANLPRRKDADIGAQIPSFAAQTEPYLQRNFPYFILSLEAFEEHELQSSEGVVRALDGKYKLKMRSKWSILAPAIRAAVRLIILEQKKWLYCCPFPSNYEFERETLEQLWMGLLQHPKECVAKERFRLFLDAGYIFKSRKDFLTGRDKYKIDVKKVTTRFKDRNLYAMIDDENAGMDSSTSWHHVSIVSKNIDKKVFQILKGHRELRSVLFIPDYGSSLKRIPSSFFTALPYMQALDLSGSHISELPSTVGYMTHLHYLDLSFTLIERLPESICQLQELQTLRLRECKHLHALPKGMKALVNLYHLEFDVLGQLSSMPKGLRCLTKLRTLSAFIVSVDGCSLGDLKYINKLCGSFCISGLEHATSKDARKAKIGRKSGIKRLHLKWDYSKYYKDIDRQLAVFVLKELMPDSFLEELQISYYPGLEYPLWMGNLYWFLIHSITLLKCDFHRLPVLGDLKYLKHLKIFNLNRVTEMKGRGGRYEKLETLAIDGMLRLESWHKVEDGDYPCLSKLTISRCSKLRELPPNFALLPSLKYLELSHCKSLQSVPDKCFQSSLDTLMIINCPLLKKRCSNGGDDWEKIKEVQNIWVDMKDMKDVKYMKDRDKDKDASSEDELIYYDESDEEEKIPNVQNVWVDMNDMKDTDEDLSSEDELTYSDESDEEEKIPNVQDVWVGTKDMKDKDEDLSSEDELTYSDESDEECAETPSTSAETPSTSERS